MHNKGSGLEQLIYLFSKLPGLGQRSARRIVLHLLEDKDLRLQGLIDGLNIASQDLQNCKICGNIDSSSPCRICLSESRDKTTIALVESVAELWALERSGFSGQYFVLGKQERFSDSKNMENAMQKLLQRCQTNETVELIIATNATLEGQTTAYYITEYFQDFNIKITRLASGIPIGGELDYLDDGTLEAALLSRKVFS